MERDIYIGGSELGRGRVRKGPFPLEGMPYEPVDMAQVDAVVEGMRVPVDRWTIRGLLSPFSAPARVALLVLLSGRPRRVAAAAATVKDDTLARWVKTYPEFAEAVGLATSLGFGAVYEAEAYDRALDRDDRGSARLLELILKRHEPEFRDKAQVELSIRQAAVQAESDWLAAAGPPPITDGPEPMTETA